MLKPGGVTPNTRLVTWLLAVCGLCSCATPYQEMGYLGGYKDIRLDSNTVSVSFEGNGGTPRQTVETYLLYRCAEVTRDAGYDYFVILNQLTEANFAVAPGQYTSSTFATRSRGSSTMQSSTTGTYFQGPASAAYTSQALIKMFKGRKPAESAAAFDAQDIIEHLGPQVRSDSDGPQRPPDQR